MTIARRFLNLKVIAIAAALLFIVGCYFAGRVLTAAGVEVGMSREQVVKVLGEPAKDMRMNPPAALLDRWDKIDLGPVLELSIYVTCDLDNKVKNVEIMTQLFGHHFRHIKQ